MYLSGMCAIIYVSPVYCYRSRWYVGGVPWLHVCYYICVICVLLQLKVAREGRTLAACVLLYMCHLCTVTGQGGM